MSRMYLFFMLLYLFVALNVYSQEKIDWLIFHHQEQQALQLIEEQLQQQPKAILYLKKGLVQSSLQNYQDAVRAFSAGLDLEPGNTELPAELADALAAMGNYHEAKGYYQRAVELHPEDRLLAAKLGRNYIQLEDYQQAYSVFSHLYTADSSRVYWNKQFAFSAYQTGRTGQAIRLYERIISLNPGDYSSYMNLIKLYQQSEQEGRKLQVIEKGLQQFPGDPGLLQVQATHYFNLRQYETARETFENYFAAGGDSLYKTLLNYGISLYFSKEEEKAISMLDVCASQVVNDPYVLFYLSLSHKKQHRYEVAEAYMKAAIEAATPAYLPEMYHHLGQLLGQQRMFEESIAALKKANELDPANHEVLFEIATTYEEFNANKTLALNYYNLYLREAGESAQNAGYALERMSRIREELFFGE